MNNIAVPNHPRKRYRTMSEKPTINAKTKELINEVPDIMSEVNDHCNNSVLDVWEEKQAEQNEELRVQYEERAAAEIKGGGRINIETMFPEISITMSNGELYFFDGYDAQEMLEEVPSWISAEDYILAQAQNW